MKTNKQKLEESILDAVMARRAAKYTTNAGISKVHKVSKATVANKVKRLCDRILEVESIYDEGINDDRFLLSNLDADIALIVIDNMEESKGSASVVNQSRTSAIREQFKRIWDAHQEQYKLDKVTAKNHGIIK